MICIRPRIGEFESCAGPKRCCDGVAELERGPQLPDVSSQAGCALRFARLVWRFAYDAREIRADQRADA